MASIRDADLAGSESDDEPFNYEPAVGSDNEDDDADNHQKHEDEDEDDVRRSRPASGKHGRRPSPDEDDQNGDADEDEEGGEEEEGEGDEEEDEEDEEDEDEEEVVGHARKRRKRDARLQFIDVEAEVDEEDEEELDEDDELPEETHPDDLLDMPAGAETDDRRHRELDRQRELEASMDAEKQAAALKERYGRNRTAAMDSAVLPQRLLLPSVEDPTIWGVKCKPGKEKEVIYDVLKRMEDRANTREPLEIYSAFERGNIMQGYIYVEARKQSAVLAAVDNIMFCYPRGKIVLVPLKEMPDLLRVKKSKELTEGMYVRIKGSGLYAGDLAQIVDVEANGTDVTIRLVPRLDYGLNEDPNAAADAKRKRPGTLTSRPPQRLFSENEAKKRHGKFLAQVSSFGRRIWQYKKDQYVDGFLEKTVRSSLLQIENVNPRLEEVTRFAAGGEDGTENLDLQALAATLKQTTSGADYLPGDLVEIYQGEQQGVCGKALAVHNDIVTIKVTDGDLKGQTVEAPVKTLRKLFRDGDHVKVVGGSKYHDEVGMVIKVRDDRVTLLTDSTNQEITVFSKDLRVATDSGGAQGDSKYDLFELVQLDAATVACVIKVDRESLRILDQNGTVRTVLPSNISNRIDRRRNAVATDRDGSEIRTDDTVKEYGGEQRQGRVLHIHRNFLFVQNMMRAENAGVFVVRAGNVTTVAAKGGRVNNAGPDLSKMNPALQRNQGPNGAANPVAMMPPPKTIGRDRLIGKTVIVRKGPYKGLLGIVKDTTDLEARVELHTKNKTITVAKEVLGVKDPVTGQSVAGGGRGRGMPSRPGGGYTPSNSRVPEWQGGRTPVGANGGGRTPAWGMSSRTPAWQGNSGGSTSYGGAGGRTPAWSSSRTPAWSGGNDGSRTAYGDGNRTAYGGDGNRTAYGGSSSSTWSASARTPYGGSSGWGGDSGSKTPAWSANNSSYSGGRTPAYQPNANPTPQAWQGNHATPGAFDAPTPGFSAPTPAADGPTPRGYGGGYGGYGGYGGTPAAAPTPGGYPETPGAGYGMPETPAAGAADDDAPRYE